VSSNAVCDIWEKLIPRRDRHRVITIVVSTIKHIFQTISVRLKVILNNPFREKERERERSNTKSLIRNDHITLRLRINRNSAEQASDITCQMSALGLCKIGYTRWCVLKLGRNASLGRPCNWRDRVIPFAHYVYYPTTCSQIPAPPRRILLKLLWARKRCFDWARDLIQKMSSNSRYL